MSSSSATPAPVLRRHEAHRDEMAFAQRLLERRVQLLGRDLALLQVERHQVLVDLDHLVDQRAVRVGDRGEVGFAGGIEEAVDDALAAVRRQVDRQALLAERRLDRASSAGRSTFSASILLTMIMRHSRALRRPVHHARRDHLDAGLRVDDDRRGLDRVERADRLPEEIGKAGRVDQVDARVLRVEVKRPTRAASAARSSPADRNRRPWCRARRCPASVIAPALSSSASASVVLPDAAVADQRDGANVLGGVFRHASYLLDRLVIGRIIPGARRRAPAGALPRDSIHGLRIYAGCGAVKRARGAASRTTRDARRSTAADAASGRVEREHSRRLRSSSSSWYGLPR